MSCVVPDPRVSITMSVYNGAHYLDEAVSSIRSQTYPNFEFIIVDDGSNDGSSEILAKHQGQDSRLRLVRQKNQGLIESLHVAFSAATGEFIARMDADDVAKPDRLEKQIRYLDSNPAIALVGSAVEIIDGASRVVTRASVLSDPESVRSCMRERGCAIFHPTVMMRRSAWDACGGFRRAYRHAEDYDLWLRMLEKFDLSNLEEPLLGYRRHKGCISFTNARQQAISSLCARRMAQLRLLGELDRTAEYDLITDCRLAELGMSQDQINEAIFTHMTAVTEDLVRSGVSSAAAEFPAMAHDYALSPRVRSVSAKLNRIALRVTADRSERKAHRTRLLATSPALYWELFGSTCSNVTEKSTD